MRHCHAIEAASSKGESVSVGLIGNAADVYPELVQRGITPDIVTDQTSAHDLLYGYIPTSYSLEEVKRVRESDPAKLEQDARVSIAREVEAMLTFKRRGAIVFDNGNNIRSQAYEHGVKDAFEIDIFTEAYLRPLFSRAIGPFRWISLTGEASDIRTIDNYILEHFSENKIVTNWISLANKYVPFQGLPARIGWFGHGERTKLALAVNKMVRDGVLSGPIAYSPRSS